MSKQNQFDLEKKHQEDLKRIAGFRLLDDDFMTKVFEDIGCTELLLQIILERDDLKVLSITPQDTIKNLQGRSIRMDIHATDSEGKLYNIEVQRSDRGAVAKRARYNSSLIDANITEPGEAYEKLSETYVIFITENDVLKRDLPIYHIDRIVAETGEPFGDEAHIIYVNAQIQGETALGKLMHDFACTDPNDMYNATLANRVRYFKEDQKGVAVMCKVMEDMRNESLLEGRLEAKKEMALNLYKAGTLSIEQIAAAANVTTDQVKQWLADSDIS